VSGGVLVLHAWWGLNDDARTYAERLRGEGFVTEVPDLYHGRVAATIADAEKLAKGLDGARATTDVDAALTKLAGRADRVAVVGWSMGASYGLELAQARSAGIGALVLYYPGMDDVYADAKLPPILVHFADHDEFESLADARRVELVASARSTAQFHVYPGTKHWFDEPSRPEYDKAASEQAWKRSLAFLDTHLRR
jgi:carboxymethylenebutenolidase